MADAKKADNSGHALASPASGKNDIAGKEAYRPSQIPVRGWKQILLRVYSEVNRDHVGLVSAGVAFFGLLALFPAITALMAIAGLVLEPEEVTRQIENLAAMMPQGAAEIVIDQAVAVAGSRESGLGLAVIFGFGLALYSASKGVASLVEGLNMAYGETETRGIIHLTILKLALTLFLIIGMTAGLSAIVVLPSILSLIDLGPTTEALIGVARWAILLVMTSLGIAVLYRFGPNRSAAKWRWLTPGAALACVLWIVASYLFSYYAENFGSYNESFGTLGGVILLLMWLWISAYVLLVGAEVNAESELQTRRDSTVGPDMPLGYRGAVKADTRPG